MLSPWLVNCSDIDLLIRCAGRDRNGLQTRSESDSCASIFSIEKSVRESYMEMLTGTLKLEQSFFFIDAPHH
jgi:hypothetical protein